MSNMTIQQVNAQRLRCKRCRCIADIVWIDESIIRAEMFELKNQKKNIDFISRIRNITGCSSTEAKSTYCHLAKSGRKCHRCGKSLPEGEVLDCDKCQSLNIVWEP